jgi:hypothetical protein
LYPCSQLQNEIFYDPVGEDIKNSQLTQRQLLPWIKLSMLFCRNVVNILLTTQKHLPQFTTPNEQRMKTKQIARQKVSSVSSCPYRSMCSSCSCVVRTPQLSQWSHTSALFRDTQSLYFWLYSHATQEKDAPHEQATHFNSNTRNFFSLFMFLSFLL